MKSTLTVLVENHAGVLSKVSGLFSRRGFNIDSLSVGITEDPAISRITIVVNGDDSIVEQVEKQLNKVIPVIKVKKLKEGEYFCRELCFAKVSATPKQRGEIVQIAEIMRAKIIDATATSLTIECTDCTDRIESLLTLLKPYGFKEVVRTGVTAIEKGAKATN